nr:serine/threonine-protein kinase 16-like isoform X1 [Lepeophtheirus salmonis]
MTLRFTTLSYINSCICSKKTLEINGRPFTVLDHLADGGFSQIDLVENQETRQTFALKTIECHSKEDEEAAFQEIEYYKQLDHDNLVRLRTSCQKGELREDTLDTSKVLLLFTYYPRGSLNEELTRRAESRVLTLSTYEDFFPQIVILNLFDQICEGLAALHAASPYPLAHRDLKPHNILLTNDFSPIIIDLGSTSKARVKISSSYEAKDIQDTAAKRSSMTYRSPELFQVDVNSELDERTDIWSLGCLLFALCFFKSPFDVVYERGDSVALAVQSSSNVHFPNDSPYSKEIHELIEWMLTLDISKRPYLDEVMKRMDVIRDDML